MFGQYVFASQPTDGGFGVHIGYANQGGDISSACSDDPTQKCSQLNFENTTDVMGVYRTAEFGRGWSGLFMAGYSRLKAEIEFEDGVTVNSIDVGGRKKSGTHSGYKLAAGVQKTFSENVSMQALAQYADYGRETYKFNNGLEAKVDAKSLGFRIAVSYHF